MKKAWFYSYNCDVLFTGMLDEATGPSHNSQHRGSVKSKYIVEN